MFDDWFDDDGSEIVVVEDMDDLVDIVSIR